MILVCFSSTFCNLCSSLKTKPSFMLQWQNERSLRQIIFLWIYGKRKTNYLSLWNVLHGATIRVKRFRSVLFPNWMRRALTHSTIILFHEGFYFSFDWEWNSSRRVLVIFSKFSCLTETIFSAFLHVLIRLQPKKGCQKRRNCFANQNKTVWFNLEWRISRMKENKTGQIWRLACPLLLFASWTLIWLLKRVILVIDWVK